MNDGSNLLQNLIDGELGVKVFYGEEINILDDIVCSFSDNTISYFFPVRSGAFKQPIIYYVSGKKYLRIASEEENRVGYIVDFPDFILQIQGENAVINQTQSEKDFYDLI